MIKFENYFYLIFILILIPILILFFINIRQLKKSYSNILNSDKIIAGIKLRTLFFSLAWIFLILSLACPLWGAKPVSVRRKGVSVMIVADISKSMTAQDIKPSRLSVQKQFLKMFLEKLKRASCGLVITKGEGILTVPLTYEKHAMFSAIDSLSPHIFSSYGTNLEAGILLALNSFGEKRGNSKIIILCTDGGETEGSLLRAAEAVKKTEAVLLIVGFGTEAGAKISVYDETGSVKLIDSKLDESFLNAAASASGDNSKYFRATQAGAIADILKIIDAGVDDVEKMIYIQEPVKRNFEMLVISFIFICLGGLSFYGKEN
ncbi:vWA domain-containing protein [Treponema pedis]|uniref:vWA domain-containing protein n=1 Tax=Treponema pedis TaxID=409322 RepID=UPI00313403CB